MNLKRMTMMVGLACILAACSSNPQTTAPSAQAQGQTQMQARTMPTPLPTREVVASTTVAADGALVLGAPAISLGFDVNGKVVSVNAVAGQTVKKGDVLATIDDTTLHDAVTDAQLALSQVETTISQQNAPATDEEIAAAQAALSAAYASYNTTKAGNTQSEIDKGKASLDSAWLRYKSSKASRDIACGEDNQSTRCQSAEASLGNAYESWAAAKVSYEALLEPVSKDTLTQAYSSVASAKAKLDSLKAGVSEEQSKIDEAQYNQAQSALERARANLEKAKLVSPCDCVVQEANVAAGIDAPASAFTLIDLSVIQFQTTSVTERDVSLIQVGAPVSIRLKSYDGVFTGKVSAVLTQSSGTQSDTALFTVLIALDETDKMLLPGMTGQAEISY